MKLTKSRLKQIIKEELQKVLEMHDATRDEWGVASFGDREKFPEHYYPWMASHWRDQILKYVEERQPPCEKSSRAGTSHSSWPCIPNRPIWRSMAQALAAAGIHRPGEEADAVIADVLADWTERERNPVGWGRIPSRYAKERKTRGVKRNETNNRKT